MIIDLADAVPETCGGKAGTLGALVRAGVPVPDGFVVPYGVAATELRDALDPGLDRLGDVPVAVRSSASNEDTDASSAAGRYDSFLGVRGLDRVAEAVASCADSMRSSRALDHPTRVGRNAAGRDADVVELAVLVQRLVDADVSGVLFTPTGPDGATRIEASWGLGPSVVGGTVTPDAYRITADGVIIRRIADKGTRLDRRRDALVVGEVPPASRTQSTLDDATVRRLVEFGGVVAGHLGAAQDIEWAIADGHLWILQARPITAALPAPPPMAAAGPIAAAAGPGALSGTPGSQGTASGPTRIVPGPADFARVRPGDILVCTYTDPAWTPLLRTVAGVITETGGVLSHAAIVARECRIPAVLGVPGATTRLQDGAMIILDGRLGTVATHQRRE